MLRDGPRPTRTLQRPLHPWHRHVLRKGALVSSAGFVHLHTHSEYSDFDGLSSVERLVQAASADGQGAVAITDHGRLASLAALRSACQAVGDVKPIPGIEAYIVVSGTRHDPGTIEVAADSDDLDADGSTSSGTQARTKTKKYEHLTILAATPTGLLNLIEMSNVSQETKFGTHPLIDYELLARYGEGLIVLTGCIGGRIAGPLSRITGQDPEADAAEHARAQGNLEALIDRKSTRLNSSHVAISYAVFCLKKKKTEE